MHVRFGSVADVSDDFSLMSAFGGKAVVRPTIFFTKILNVCFHQKRSFDVPKIRDIVRLLSAKSGRPFYSATDISGIGASLPFRSISRTRASCFAMSALISSTMA